MACRTVCKTLLNACHTQSQTDAPDTVRVLMQGGKELARAAVRQHTPATEIAQTKTGTLHCLPASSPSVDNLKNPASSSSSICRQYCSALDRRSSLRLRPSERACTACMMSNMASFAMLLSSAPLIYSTESAGEDSISSAAGFMSSQTFGTSGRTRACDCRG